MRNSLSVLFAVLLSGGCAVSEPSVLDPAQAAVVESSVRELTATIAADLAREGPDGWLPHFSDEGTFFMVSDGVMVFPDLDTAVKHVHALDATISRMDLIWDDIRVTPMSLQTAVVAAAYHELLVNTAGGETRFKGFVTMLAVNTKAGWRLQHLHWSTPVSSTSP